MKSKKFSKGATNHQSKKLDSVNPFEIHVNRSNYQVLGSNSKSDQGLPGTSKNKALQKRKKTLLQEYKMKNKVNQFIDQRIGVRNFDMTEDDKMMARFTAQRKRLFIKKAIFNLSEPEVLTHRGQTLSEIERFEDVRSGEEDEDDSKTKGTLKRKFVGDAHFGGGTLTKSGKDRESLIDELINESKKRKMDRQRNKEETLEETEQLDEKWKTLGMIVTSTKELAEENNPISARKNNKSDEFDMFKLQLKFEPQAQASQRLKTDEEVAKEDKEKLERLEQERKKQLSEIQYKNFQSADDLDDGSFKVCDPDESDNSSVSDEMEQKEDVDSNEEEEEEEEEDSDEKEGSVSGKELVMNTVRAVKEEEKDEREEKETSDDEAASDDDSNTGGCAMDDISDLVPALDVRPSLKTSCEKNLNVGCEKSTQPERSQVQLDTVTNTQEDGVTSKKLLEVTEVITLDLPYVIKVPESYEDFKDLFHKHSVAKINIVIERMVKCNHPSICPENKQGMLKLSEYFIKLIKEEDLEWECLVGLVHLYNQIKEFNHEACVNQLLDTVSEFVEESLEVTVKFVAWYVLLFVKPESVEMLLPLNKSLLSVACLATDSQAVALSDHRRISLGLLFSYLLLQDAKTSSSLYINTVDFLTKCLVKAVNEPELFLKATEDNSRSSTSERCRIPECKKLFLADVGSLSHSLGREQVLHYCVDLLTEFLKAYSKFPQAKTLFHQLQLTLSTVNKENLPSSLGKNLEDLIQLLKLFQSAALPPLSKIVRQPKALRQYEPSFHAVTYDTRHQHKGLSEERRAEQKLLHKYKAEKKGAMRELRRDRTFLANVKLKENEICDERRMKKVKEIFGDAATQQGELRRLKRKK